MLNAKVSLTKAMSILSNMFSSPYMKQGFENIYNDLLNGKSMAEGMQKQKLIFNSQEITMVKVGEEVNKLDYVLQKISENTEEKLKDFAAAMASYLEPLIIIFIGSFVGFILIAMYLPIFKLSQLFF